MLSAGFPGLEAKLHPDHGPLMTLGGAAMAGARLIGWCKARGYQVEPDPIEIAASTSSLK
jgi:hypothetical protein